MVEFANNDDGILVPEINITPKPELIRDLTSVFTDAAMSSLETIVETRKAKV